MAEVGRESGWGMSDAMRWIIAQRECEKKRRGPLTCAGETKYTHAIKIASDPYRGTRSPKTTRRNLKVRDGLWCKLGKKGSQSQRKNKGI